MHAFAIAYYMHTETTHSPYSEFPLMHGPLIDVVGAF
jgi:hypothetical protein